MNFVYIFIAVFIGIWADRIYTRTEVQLRENELLEELRKLCNELLKIKDKGTIVITGLSVSKEKSPSRVIVTTLPKEDLQKSIIHERPGPKTTSPTSRP